MLSIGSLRVIKSRLETFDLNHLSKYYLIVGVDLQHMYIRGFSPHFRSLCILLWLRVTWKLYWNTIKKKDQNIYLMKNKSRIIESIRFDLLPRVDAWEIRFSYSSSWAYSYDICICVIISIFLLSWLIHLLYVIV